MDEVLERLVRIEEKLNLILLAIAEEDEPGKDLEGNPLPAERPENQTL